MKRTYRDVSLREVGFAIMGLSRAVGGIGEEMVGMYGDRQTVIEELWTRAPKVMTKELNRLRLKIECTMANPTSEVANTLVNLASALDILAADVIEIYEEQEERKGSSARKAA